MSATAQGCGNAVNIEAASNMGVNGTSVSAPTVFNYPVQPADDSGRMMALASIIGGLFDALLGGDALDDAEDAQNTWKSILDGTMTPRGQSELARVDTERAKMADFELDLKNQLTDYRAKADVMWPKLDPMDAKIQSEIDEQRTKSDDEFDFSNITCLDDAIDKLCEYVGCGYTPDYQGIATRARADAEIQAMKAYQEACRTGNRYNTRRTQSSLLDIRLATRSAALVATANAREKERQYAFDTNLKMRNDHAAFLEKTRMGRRELSIKYDEMAMRSLTERWTSFAKLYLDLEKSGDNISTERWKAFSAEAFKSYELGGSMLAASMQAYQALAASIRASAKQSGGGGGLAGLMAQFAAVYMMFSGSCDPIRIPLLGKFYPRPQSCCGGCGDPAKADALKAECLLNGGTWSAAKCECTLPVISGI